MSLSTPSPTQARSRLDRRIPQRRPHLDHPRRIPLPPPTPTHRRTNTTTTTAPTNQSRRRTTTILTSRRQAERALAGNRALRAQAEAAVNLALLVTAPRCPPHRTSICLRR